MITDENHPSRLRLPPIIWNYIETLANPNASRFQRDIAMQMLEDIGRACNEAIHTAKSQDAFRNNRRR